MKSIHKHLVTAALLAGLGATAVAQSQSQPAPAAAQGTQMAHRGQHMDPAKRQEMRQVRMERRLAELKLKLAITGAQEGAWNAFVTAMKPTQRPRIDRAELEKLATPERIDRMRALRNARMAEQDRRGDATKQFYAALNADQKKVFDGLRIGGGKRGMRGHHGRHHG
jgi:periplasmic protein CpxP/Spy